MLRFVEMDDNVTYSAQMEQACGPVVLINKFNVAPEHVEAFLAAWAGTASVMKQQPGYISTQLHKGVGGSCVFVNVAVWETMAGYRRAFGNSEFQAKLVNFPPSTVTSPHLFQKIAVPGVCLG
jgi:heme-degrading monooxygenase HmoA